MLKYNVNKIRETHIKNQIRILKKLPRLKTVETLSGLFFWNKIPHHLSAQL